MLASISRGVYILLLFALAHVPAFAQSVPHAFTIEGRLYNQDGTPLSDTNTDVQLEVVSESNTSCVLYREVHAGVNFSNPTDPTAVGVFALELGSGTPSMTKPSFVTLFSPGTMTGDSCTTTSTAGQHRYVRVGIKNAANGNTYEFFPLTMISSVPTAVVADSASSLQGLGTTAFVQTNAGSLTQSNVANIFSAANYPKLEALLSGTSSQYLISSPTSSVNFNNQQLVNVATPATGAAGLTNAVNRSYADSKIAGLAVDSTVATQVGAGFGGGKVMVWDQATNQWTAGTATDSTKLPLAGGTMTGSINMGAFDLTNVGYITMGTQRYLGLGRYTNAQESALIATPLNASHKGVSWYNSDTDTYKIWNGTAAVAQANLVSGKLDPSWMPSTTVTAGTYGSQTQIPVVTIGADGRITSAYGTSFTGGGSPTGNAGGDLTGTYPNPSIASSAVTTAKIADASITGAKLNTTNGAAISRLVATDSVVPGSLTYFECSTNDQIISWTAAGWACTTVGALAPVKTVAGKTPVSGNIALNAYDITGIESAATKDYGTAAGELVELDGTGRIPASLMPAILPAIDGSALSNVNAARIGGRAVSTATPGTSQVLTWNGSQWEAQTPAAGGTGTVTAVGAGTGLVSTTITGFGTINIDVGTGVNKIPQLGASGAMMLSNGAAGTPVYTFATNSSTGMYRAGANKIGFSTAGVARMAIDSVGNVGIGTTTPDAGSLLHVSGAVDDATMALISNSSAGAMATSETRYVNDGGGYGARFGVGSTGYGITEFRNRAFIMSTYLGITLSASDTNGDIRLHTGGANAERVRVSPGGNVGIGDTNPTVALSIVGTGTNSALLVPRDTTANRPSTNVTSGMIRYNTTTNKFEFYENGTWVNYGVGGTGVSLVSADAATGLLGGNITTGGTIRIDVGTGAGKIPQVTAGGQLLMHTGAVTAPTYSFGGDGDTGMFSPAANTLTLATAGTARLTMLTNGNMGIGTTNPVVSLEINEANSSPEFRIVNTSSLTARNPGVTVQNFSGGFGGYPSFNAIASRGSNAAPAAVQANDVLGSIAFNGANNASWGYSTGAEIHAEAEGTYTNASTPGRLVLSTTPSGSTFAAERMRITGSGNIGIGDSNPSVALSIAGTGTNSALLVPRDSTANRPSTNAQAGMIRYNTTTLKFEFYENGLWVNYNTGSGAATPVAFPLLAGPTGSATAPAYAFSGDSDTGMFSTNANTLSFATGGASRMTLDSAGQLQVGALAVYGSTNAAVFSDVINYHNGTQSEATLRFQAEPTASARGYVGRGSASNTNLYMRNRLTLFDEGAGLSLVAQNGDFRFYTGGTPTERMRFNDNGLGIYDTNPSVGLVVNATGTTSAILVPRDSTLNRPAGNVANGMIRYNTNLNKFEFYENGNWANLGVASAGDFRADGTVAMSGAFRATAGLVGSPSITFSGDTDTGIYSPAANTLSLATQGTARLTAGPTGNVGIGTTTPAYALDVKGLTSAAGYAINGTTVLAIRPTGGSLAIGFRAGNSSLGSYQTFVGEEAGYSHNNASGTANTVVGYRALYTSTTGNSNSILGFQAARYNDGANNVVMGADAAAQGSGYASDNVILGQGAAYPITNGSDNTIVGAGAAPAITTGNSNIILGYNSGQNLTTGSNNIVIGNNVVADSGAGSNSLNLGDVMRANLTDGRILLGGNLMPAGSAALEIYGLGAKSAVIIPRDTTANRPLTAVGGMMRFNTTTNEIEMHNGTLWKTLTAGDYIPATNGTANGNFTVNGGNLIVTGSLTTYADVVVTNGNSLKTNNIIPFTNGGPLTVSSGTGSALILNSPLNYVTVGTSSLGFINEVATDVTNLSAASAVFKGGLAVQKSMMIGQNLFAPAIYGTTSASGLLLIDSTTSATKGVVRIAPTGGAVHIGDSGTTTFTVAANGSGRMSIGTLTPGTAMLQIVQGTGALLLEMSGSAPVGINGFYTPARSNVSQMNTSGNNNGNITAFEGNTMITHTLGTGGFGSGLTGNFRYYASGSYPVGEGVGVLGVAYQTTGASINQITEMSGVSGAIRAQANGNVGTANGLKADVVSTIFNPSIITNLNGIRSTITNTVVSGGTINQASVGRFEFYGTASNINTLYGVYLGNLSQATVNTYGFFQQGNEKNYFGGRIGIGNFNPHVALEIAATGTTSAILLPRDSTANRPTSNVGGLMRYNNTTNKFEGFENGEWKDFIQSPRGTVTQFEEFMTVPSVSSITTVPVGNAMFTTMANTPTLNSALLANGDVGVARLTTGTVAQQASLGFCGGTGTNGAIAPTVMFDTSSTWTFETRIRVSSLGAANQWLRVGLLAANTGGAEAGFYVSQSASFWSTYSSSGSSAMLGANATATTGVWVPIKIAYNSGVLTYTINGTVVTAPSSGNWPTAGTTLCPGIFLGASSTTVNRDIYVDYISFTQQVPGR